MSYYIVIHGTLGTGKSTMANELAVKLDAEQIRLDDVLSEHKLDLHEDGETSISAFTFIKGLDFVLPHAREVLDRRKVVIFDGCFYHKEVMDYLLDHLAYPHVLFTLKAPLDVCIQRDRNRPKTIGEDVAKAVYELTEGLNFGEIIDTTEPLKDSVEKLLSHLPKF